jgi:ureidoglycolate lyase
MRLQVEDLHAEAFAPFGEVIQQPRSLPNAMGNGWRWWGEIALLTGDERPYGIGYLDLEPADLRFDWAERHMYSAELLIPAGGDCLVYVGPPDHPDQPDRMPPLESFRVFRVRAGQGVLLHPGVWHGAPLAIDRRLNVVVLLLQGTGTRDTSVVRFSDSPVEMVLDGAQD